MSVIPHEDLLRLAEVQDGVCVSIYLPTHRAGNEIEQDRIRFKNLLGEAEAQLIEAGLDEGQTERLLAPIQNQLGPQSTFWQHQLDGLCIFRSAELLYAYRLPFSFEELTVVGSSFHVKPLLPLLSGDGQFYLMTLHQDEIDVYQGTNYALSLLEIEELPEHLSELLLERDLERPQQWHTGTRGAGGHPRAIARPAAFHGHGAIEQSEEDDILRYYRQVDEVLDSVWGDEEIPLLLAGGDDLTHLYRRANNYAHLIEDAVIKTNPASLEPAELHQRAWEILEPRFTADKQEAAEAYRMLAGKDHEQASDDLKTVVAAAYFERVDVLFVALEAHTWGTFDPDTGEVRIDGAPNATNQDLLDLAAVHTWHNSGTVYAVSAAEMPSGGDLAAIFRY